MIRNAKYAGSFYPKNPEILRKDVAKYISQASLIENINRKNIAGIIVPHAGYVYSGAVAGCSYAQVAGNTYDLIILLAPSHHSRYDGCITPSDGEYKTPLGAIEIASDVISRIHSPVFSYNSMFDGIEHSHEVQLPFIQTAFGSTKLLPCIIGTTQYEVCEKIAKAIFDAAKEDQQSILVIMSTGLSHYHTYDEAQKIDNEFIELLSENNARKVSESINAQKSEICGGGAVITGMILTRLFGADTCKIISYANSGDTAGDKDRVVGYLSAVFY